MKRVIFENRVDVVHANTLNKVNANLGIVCSQSYRKALLIPVFRIEGVDWAVFNETFTIDEVYDNLRTALKSLDDRGFTVYAFEDIKSMKTWFGA